MDQIKIGKFIRTMRRKKDLTQRELAEAIGVRPGTVSKWECGRGMPDLEVVLPLCDTLGITFRELIHGESTDNRELTE